MLRQEGNQRNPFSSAGLATLVGQPTTNRRIPPELPKDFMFAFFQPYLVRKELHWPSAAFELNDDNINHPSNKPGGSLNTMKGFGHIITDSNPPHKEGGASPTKGFYSLSIWFDSVLSKLNIYWDSFSDE